MKFTDVRYLEAIELFNQQEFFACHDVLEELWSETLTSERDFLQGLIHVAVSLFHFGEGNLSGARKMHDSALRYLANYPDQYGEIDLGVLRGEMAICFAKLTASDSGYPTGVMIDEATIPHIQFIAT